MRFALHGRNRRLKKLQTFGIDHPQARASAVRLMHVYQAQQGGRQEEAAELLADPQVRNVIQGSFFKSNSCPGSTVGAL